MLDPNTWHFLHMEHHQPGGAGTRTLQELMTPAAPLCTKSILKEEEDLEGEMQREDWE